MMSTQVSVTGALHELHALVEGEGGTLAEALRPWTHDLERLEVFGPLVAGGRRTSRDPAGYALLVESILEGYLLHHGRGRIVRHPDADVRLLAGDYLYAFGIVRLASIGDLEAVEELADLISLCAQAHALVEDELEHAAPWPVTAALWALAVLAVADGSWPDQQNAKQIVREQGGIGAEELLSTAKDRALSLGQAPRLEQALIVFEHAVEDQPSTT